MWFGLIAHFTFQRASQAFCENQGLWNPGKSRSNVVSARVKTYEEQALLLLTSGGKDVPSRMQLPTGSALVCVGAPLLADELELATGYDRRNVVESLE